MLLSTETDTLYYLERISYEISVSLKLKPFYVAIYEPYVR